MTLDMLEILVDAVSVAMDSISKADHWVGIFFIAFVLGVGSAWALSIAAKDMSLDIFKKIFL